MRISWSLALIAFGSSLVYSTRDDAPGLSAIRSFGLLLLAIGGALLLPRYPVTSNT